MRDKVSTQQELESHEDDVLDNQLQQKRESVNKCPHQGGRAQSRYQVIKAILKYHPPPPVIQARKQEAGSNKTEISEGLITVEDQNT